MFKRHYATDDTGQKIKIPRKVWKELEAERKIEEGMSKEERKKFEQEMIAAAKAKRKK